jgi:glycosyltransferase involved in cell wall biosynthesis
MRVVQALGWYFPESIGGTENYVSGLAASLQGLGLESRIAAPLDEPSAKAYVWEGSSVFRYPVGRNHPREILDGRVPHHGFETFTTWLQAQGADLYHQHSLTTGCGLHHLRAAKALGLPTVLTIHVPGPVCLRGTMMLDGRQACDGRIDAGRCGRCWLQSRGLGSLGSGLLSRVPASLGGRFRAFGRAGTALGATALVGRHLAGLQEMAEGADRIVAVCQWLHEALLLNGVPEGKLSLNRQGVTQRPQAGGSEGPSREKGRLVIGFLGRWDPVKGLNVLVEAVRGLPGDVPVEVRAHCSNANSRDSQRFREKVLAVAAPDPRIRILPALQPGEVRAFLQSVDILAVPSQWLETGPLVVLEALAAGTPVLGSRLGGIQELVQDGVDGLLVTHDDPQAWRAALGRLTGTDLPARLRGGIHAVRTMDDVAADTLDLYRGLVPLRPAPQVGTPAP